MVLNYLANLREITCVPLTYYYKYDIMNMVLFFLNLQKGGKMKAKEKSASFWAQKFFQITAVAWGIGLVLAAVVGVIFADHEYAVWTFTWTAVIGNIVAMNADD